MIKENEYLKGYVKHLVEDEKSEATIEKYVRDVSTFLEFAGKIPLSKELVLEYKSHLEEKGYQVTSINSMLVAVNGYLEFVGCPEYKVKTIRMQRKIYCEEERELTKAEYKKLLDACKEKENLNLAMQTICCTGIRVSELKYFTVESVRQGEITVYCKKKVRTIMIPRDLKKRLLKYAKTKKIKSGNIFITKNGKPLDRSNLWSQMKKLCEKAGVLASKVFPHNLRKLFARSLYNKEKDIAKLADVLGHGSIETTRIYIMTTGVEHRRQIEGLGLLI